MEYELLKQIQENGLYNENEIDKGDKIDILINSHCKAYYKGKIKLGRKIGCYLIEYTDIDNGKKHQIRSNQLFFLESLSKMYTSLVYTLSEPIFDIDDPKKSFENEKYRTLNPSIFKDGDDLYVNVRHVSFDGPNYIPMSKDEIIKTKNTFGKLVNNQLTNDYHEIIDASTFLRLSGNVLGFEDLKIFKKQGKWNFVCTSYEASKTTCILYGILDESPSGKIWETHTVVPLKGTMVSDSVPEKNWMPILDNDDDNIHLVYSTFPFHIVKVDTTSGKVETVFSKKWSRNLGKWRGSSCLIPYKSGYLFIVHEVYFNNNKRNYVHRIVWITNQFGFMKYSDPLFLECNRIEYCNGIAFSDGKFYITYGVRDSKAKMIVIDEWKLCSLLENFLF